MASTEHILFSNGFMPHGMCYLWRPDILALHVGSDALITASYFSIPFTLLYFVRKRADLQFNWMFVCFAVFIVACGTTHLLEIFTIWFPAYWVSGAVKLVTALASVPTAILLVKLVPQALRVPSPSALQNAIDELSREVSERKRAEAQVRTINAELEDRVRRRTALLETANRDLRTQLERLALLDHTTRAIGNRLDPREILQVVIRSLEDNLPIDFGCACLRQPADSLLTVVYVGERSQSRAIELRLSAGATIGTNQDGLLPYLSGDLAYLADLAQSGIPIAPRFAAAGIASLVIAPLAVEGKVFGAIIVARNRVDGFSGGECEFLRQLGEHVALATRQAELYGALQSAYDDLRHTQQSVMQQERLRALGQMASGIAHDINNALSPAALYTQSLLERDNALTAEARRYLAIIQRAIDDVSNTVGRLRQYSRPPSGQKSVSSVDLNEAIRQVIDLTRARWGAMPQERGIVIEVELQLDYQLPNITGSETEIRDALTNLVLNAVDAMPEGGLLKLRTASASPGRVHVEVIDTGIGMDETTRVRCVEPFFTTKGERGTGLGLCMVFGMLERHGGELQIESEPGRGTLMRLIFPSAESLAPVSNEQFPPHKPLRPLRLLFVDDDPTVLQSLRDILVHEGHSIVVAEGGPQGVAEYRNARARGEPFSAVITDLGMPHMDGEKVAAAIKSEDPRVPVILLTGWGDRLTSGDGAPRNVDRVLGKPPKLTALRLVLAELTGQDLTGAAQQRGSGTLS